MEKGFVFISGLFFLSLSSIVFAQTNGVGLGGLWYQSPYLGERSQFYPGPLIEYDSKYLFVSGISAGVHIWESSGQQLDALIQFQPLGLKPSDNDDVRVRQLGRRKPTLLAGVSYSIGGSWGNVKGGLLADVLDNSRSVLIGLEYAYILQLAEQIFLLPQIGAVWANDKHNRYYYGVSTNESLRSSFSVYRPDSGVTTYAGLMVNYRFNMQWSARLGYQFSLLSHEAKSSPIVNRSNIQSLTFGVVYHF